MRTLLLALLLLGQEDKESTAAVAARIQAYLAKVNERGKFYVETYGKLRVPALTLAYEPFFITFTRGKLDESLKNLARLKDGKIARAEAATLDEGMKVWTELERTLDDGLRALRPRMEELTKLREASFAPATPDSERLRLDVAERERRLAPLLHELKYDVAERACFVAIGLPFNGEQQLRASRGLPGQDVPTKVDGDWMYCAIEAGRRLRGFELWLYGEERWLQAFLAFERVHGLDSRPFFERHLDALRRATNTLNTWVKQADVVYFADGMRNLRADHAKAEKALNELLPIARRRKALDDARIAGKLDDEGFKELDRLGAKLDAALAEISKSYFEKTYFQPLPDEKDRYLITGMVVHDRLFETRRADLEKTIRENEGPLRDAETKVQETARALEAETAAVETLNDVVRKLKDAADDAARKAAVVEPETPSAEYNAAHAALAEARRVAGRKLVRFEEEDAANRKAPSETGQKTVDYCKAELEKAEAALAEARDRLARERETSGVDARREKAAAAAADYLRKLNAKIRESDATAARLAESREAHEKALAARAERRKTTTDAREALERLDATSTLRVTAARVADEATVYYESAHWTPKEGLALIDEAIREAGLQQRLLDVDRQLAKAEFLDYNRLAIDTGDRHANAIMTSFALQAAVETAFYVKDYVDAFEKGGPPAVVAELAKKAIERLAFGEMTIEEPELKEIRAAFALPTSAEVEKTAAKRLKVKQPAGLASEAIATKFVESRALDALKEALEDDLLTARQLKLRVEELRKARDLFASAIKKFSVKEGAKDFAKGLLKDLSKTAMKKVVAEWIEGEAALEHFAAQARAAGATQLYLLTSHRWWKAQDVKDRLEAHKAAILKTWDPVRGFRISRNEWFRRGRRLTIELEAVAADPAAKRPRVELRLGGQPAEREGDTLRFRIDADALKNNGGGVALEIFVKPE